MAETQHEAQHEVQFLTIHGHRRAFVKVGQGPAVLLLHGLGCDHTTWEPVIDTLAKRYTVIAPDLLGHGMSDKPRADYSVGGYANGMRDLLTVLGIDKVTVVGHSFGGGVAMQFAYQFPERTERMMLVGSGGLGPEVSPFIRAITTPGYHQLMGVLTLPGVRHLGVAGMRALAGTGWKATRDLDEVAEIYDSFKDPHARAAIRHVVRAVVDWKGQIVTMADRAYLTDEMPMAVVWGRDDRVIPVRHASNAAALAPKARIEVIPNAGHFPHRDHPQRFAKILHEFIRSSQPASYSRAKWRGLLRNGQVGPLSPVSPVASVTNITSA
ncbi:hydrolase [Nocardioides szechwanensis]|uniref:Pimeloyl-ACP methyl ester carboxylesterase n=1 Tax=Nocardioides szechwanensis TaxID=1005944 RepID=A0A1H0HG33_9ACTN|nr:alpha/beta fold hydrolase [Nocardioides szechwanensis]GEP34286.1 hydrolase [Nocardioides szechwanensis]SDO18060.1 Pimeloyl-ACP methyl ester carboxylesterase [Nocardioides szechwanensis]